jgi:hypothetical protein
MAVAMLPAEYVCRYGDVKVPADTETGQTPARVNIHVYRNNGLTGTLGTTAAMAGGGPKDALVGKIKETLKVAHCPSKPTKIATVDNRDIMVSATKVVGVYAGKGSPEDISDILWLARHFQLVDVQQAAGAPKKKLTKDATLPLSTYCDNYVGLDCNGFVGNYIWYGKKGKAWSKPGFNDLKGPDSIITNFFKGAPAVTRWEDIKSSNTYIFGLVDHTGHVVPGGKGPAGHIMITQAGESSKRLNWDTYNPRLWVVESTAGAINPGLTEGWYECIDYDQKKGVFTLDRGPDIMPLHRQISCKIVQLV